jgi:hypothetical protein
MRSILLVVVVLIGFEVAAQRDTLMTHFENRLEKSLKSLRSAGTDEDKKNANNSFRSLLLETIQYSESFFYLFPKLSTLGAVISPDKSLKIYSWNVELSDKSNKFYCFIVRPGKRRKKNKVIELIEKSDLTRENQTYSELNWYGCLYYKIIPIKKGSKQLYTLLGWRNNGTLSNLKVIDALSISGNHAKLGEPIFQSKKTIDKRVVLEYSIKSSMTLRFEDKYARIVFDHLSPENPSMSGFNEYYVPDMSYDAFEFKDGKWVLNEDVVTINDPGKKTFSKIIIDPTTGEEIKEEVENKWIDPSDYNAPGGINKHTPSLPKQKK